MNIILIIAALVSLISTNVFSMDEKINPEKSDGNIVVISLDYDGCGDVLFDQIRESDSEDIVAHDRYKRILESRFLEITAGAKVVDLYSGSARQDWGRELELLSQNKNGSCFKNYAQLASAWGWTFRKLLLADTLGRVAPGTFMDNMHLQSWIGNDAHDKRAIIEGQLNDVKKNHGQNKVDFYFIDDYQDILERVQIYFLQYPDKVPTNVTMHYINFENKWLELQPLDETPQESKSPTEPRDMDLEVGEFVIVNPEKLLTTDDSEDIADALPASNLQFSENHRRASCQKRFCNVLTRFFSV